MTDSAVRAITSDGEFRVVCAVVTDAVQQALAESKAGPDASELFGRAMVGTVLLRSAVHPSERFQYHIRGVGPAAEIRVDSWPEGGLRGYVTAHDDGERAIPVTNQVFTVSRTRRLAGDEPFQSILAVVSGNVRDEVERYLQFSEQIESSVRIEVVLADDGAVIWAGGVLTMPLPEAEHEDLQALVQALESQPPIRQSFERAGFEGMVEDAIPSGYGFTMVAEEAQHRLCVCSRERVLSMLRSLGAEQLQSLIDDGEPVVVDCAYCPEKRFEASLLELADLAGAMN